MRANQAHLLLLRVGYNGLLDLLTNEALYNVGPSAIKPLSALPYTFRWSCAETMTTFEDSTAESSSLGDLAGRRLDSTTKTTRRRHPSQ